MENKVRVDGTILNELKLTEFGSCLIRLQNKRTYTRKDGKEGQSSCTLVVSGAGRVAQEAVTRFKRGDIIRVEGNLIQKNTKKLDQEGREIYELWIQAYKIDAIPGITEGKPLSTPATQKQNHEYSQAKQQPAKQPTPVFKKPVVSIPQPSKQPLQAPIQDDESPFEEIFDDTLPF